MWYFPVNRRVAMFLVPLVALLGCRRKIIHHSLVDGGYLEEATDCQHIVGWAWDKSKPDASVQVELFDGTELLAVVDADLARPDVVAAGAGNGKHGFLFPVPEKLRDRKVHLIRARITGESVYLNGSPKKIECAPTPR